MKRKNNYFKGFINKKHGFNYYKLFSKKIGNYKNKLLFKNTNFFEILINSEKFYNFLNKNIILVLSNNKKDRLDYDQILKWSNLFNDNLYIKLLIYLCRINSVKINFKIIKIISFANVFILINFPLLLSKKNINKKNNINNDLNQNTSIIDYSDAKEYLESKILENFRSKHYSIYKDYKKIINSNFYCPILLRKNILSKEWKIFFDNIFAVINAFFYQLICEKIHCQEIIESHIELFLYLVPYCLIKKQIIIFSKKNNFQNSLKFHLKKEKTLINKFSLYEYENILYKLKYEVNKQLRIIYHNDANQIILDIDKIISKK